MTLPDNSPAAPAFCHGLAYFARPFVQRWVAVATGLSTGLRGPPRDVHYLPWVMMEGRIGTCWGVPIFHFTGKEVDHTPSDSVGSPRSPRKGKGKKGQGSSSNSTGSQRPKRDQEYALVFRFWQEDRIKHGRLTLAGNEYPAGPGRRHRYCGVGPYGLIEDLRPPSHSEAHRALTREGHERAGHAYTFCS